MAIALVFAMKLREPNIYLDEELEDFMANIQPPITEENYSEILRRSERSNSEITDSNNDDDDEENENDDDDAVLATLSDETENEDDDEEENELDSTIRGKSRQVNKYE